jgi:hypothetical protein
MNTPELRWWLRVFAAVAVVVAVVAGLGVWLSAQGGPQPSFGQLTLTPPNIVYNTPTNVTVTIKIDAPTLNPTTVQLQRVDAQGNVLGTIRRLYDDATHGDQTEGDKVFTAAISLNEATVGKSYFRVSAGFRGKTTIVQSVSFAIDVDPFPLPPDPGEAGKATLKGIDSDNDGVRDDLQRWIGLSYRTDSELRSALAQLTRATETFLEGADKDQSAVIAMDMARSKARDCLRYRAGGIRTARGIALSIRAEHLNTLVRSQAFLRADSKLSGQLFPASSPSTWSQSCE